MKANPGQQYITEQGDTLQKIASQAYGNPSKAAFIKNANQTQIKITVDSPLPVGLALIIPVDQEQEIIRQRQFLGGLK